MAIIVPRRMPRIDIPDVFVNGMVNSKIVSLAVIQGADSVSACTRTRR